MKNSTGVATRKGRKARFSFLYKPGAMNIHNWAAMKGKARNAAAKKATLM